MLGFLLLLDDALNELVTDLGTDVGHTDLLLERELECHVERCIHTCVLVAEHDIQVSNASFQEANDRNFFERNEHSKRRVVIFCHGVGVEAHFAAVLVAVLQNHGLAL